MQRPVLIPFVLTLVLAGLPACESLPLEPVRQVSEADLRFVRVAADAPLLADTLVSFWAVRGQARTAEIRYLNNGYGGLCLEFAVPAQALLRAPDGTPYALGDSVQITIRVVDTQRFQFEFQPAGIQFSHVHPAELTVVYRWADRDFDGDGMVSETDHALWQRFGFWRQERSAEPWAQISTQRDEDHFTAVTPVTGFTRYALASE